MPGKIPSTAALGIALLLATHAAAAADGAAPRDEPKDDGSSGFKQPSATFFWFDGGAGWGFVDLQTFEPDADTLTASFVPTAAAGPTAHVGAGVRFAPIVLGLRAGVLALTDDSAARTVGSLQLWTIDAELGFRIPLGRLEPYLLLGAGYSKFGGLGDALSGVGAGLDIDGANLRAGGGLDYFATSTFSIGARLTAEVMLLSRRAVPLRELAEAQRVGTISEGRARILEGRGTSAGTAYALAVGPGLHF